MTTRKLLLLLPLFLILSITACDENNSSSRQEDPGAMETGCPCFTFDELDKLGKDSTNIQCEIEPFSILLSFNTSMMPELAIGCLADGTGCTCQGEVLGPMDVTAEQASVCFETILNAMIMFNTSEIKLETCVLSGS